MNFTMLATLTAIFAVATPYAAARDFDSPIKGTGECFLCSVHSEQNHMTAGATEFQPAVESAKLRGYQYTNTGSVSLDRTVYPLPEKDKPILMHIRVNDPDFKERIAYGYTGPVRIIVTRDGISRTKSYKIWRADGPGAWLTHGRPGGVASQVLGEDRDDVEAVEQAQGRT